MDYKQFLDKYKGMSKEEAKNSCFDLAKLLMRFFKQLKQDGGVFVYFSALVSFTMDGEVDDDEIDFVNALNRRLGMGRDPLDKEGVNSFDNSQISTLANIYKTMSGIADENEQLKSYLNGRRFSEVYIDYLCSLAAINGDISDDEVDFIDNIVTGFYADEDDDSNSDSDDGTYGVSEDYPEPKVIKIGASLYESDYGKYFSVGAEIQIDGPAVEHLDIRVQLLDSTGFILDSFDESIFRAEPGIFRFGQEYSIDCNPSSYKVIVGARSRCYLEPSQIPSQVFKVTGMRFQRDDSSYNPRYHCACMVENVLDPATDVATDVYVVFYDANENIVGGATLSGERLYIHQPDRYDERIDCKSVINRTTTFRWSLDYFSRY